VRPGSAVKPILCATYLIKLQKGLQKEIHAKVKAIFEAPDTKTARRLLNEVLEEY